MPLSRARCPACTLPLGDPPHATLAVRCGRCGLTSNVAVAADGTPAAFDVAFVPSKIVGWFGAARIATAHGAPGVAVGACSACSTPLTIAYEAPVVLPCPHCSEPVSGAAVDVLVDQWPEPWTKVEGGGIDLEYRLGLFDDKTGIAAGCATCGAPTPPNDPAVRCRTCGAATWVVRPNGVRVQLGARVNGMRGPRPFNAVVPIGHAEAMLRQDAALGSNDRSGGALLGFTGVGCAIFIALGVVGILAIVLLVVSLR
jgi:hypothetical protein